VRGSEYEMTTLLVTHPAGLNHITPAGHPERPDRLRAVARALANRPSLILADEPTAALDSMRGRQVMELFRKVAHEQNAGVIVVTHDHRTLDLFDRILEMEDGTLRPHQSG